jgi:hypothetical protein
MKKIIATLVLASCAPLPVTEAPAPVKSATRADIAHIARGSTCAKTHWGNSIKVAGSSYTSNRGRIYTGATVGIALTYARALCQEQSMFTKIVSAAPSDNASKDQTAFMKSTFAGLSGRPMLKKVYASFFSFAAMESSGNYCEGKDASADTGTAEEAEAGMFQTSWNSRHASVELLNLMADYNSGKRSCLLDEFKEGVPACGAQDLKNYGSGPGVEYQKMNKSCPAFATEWAAIMFRVQRTHYYPLNQAGKPEKAVQKWIDPTTPCMEMLTQVERLVLEAPGACEALK